MCGNGDWFRISEGDEGELEGSLGWRTGAPRAKGKTKEDSHRIESVLFIPHTPEGGLKKDLTGMEQGLGLQNRVRYIEMVGRSLEDILIRKTPWDSTCGRQNCFLCTSGEGKCMTQGVVYSITCMRCKEREVSTQYWGESARTGFDRGVEHLRGLQNQDPNSVLWEHHSEHHGDQEDPEYKMKVEQVHKSTLSRQAAEGLAIDGFKGDILLNRKGEWGYNLAPSLSVEGQDQGGKRSGGRLQEPKEYIHKRPKIQVQGQETDPIIGVSVEQQQQDGLGQTEVPVLDAQQGAQEQPIRPAEDAHREGQIQVQGAHDVKETSKETRTRTPMTGTDKAPELDREHDEKGSKVLVRRQLTVREMMTRMGQGVDKVTKRRGKGDASGAKGKDRVAKPSVSQNREGGSSREQTGLVTRTGLADSGARGQTGGQLRGEGRLTLEQFGGDFQGKSDVGVKVGANEGIKGIGTSGFWSVRAESDQVSSSIKYPEEGAEEDSQTKEKPPEELLLRKILD